MKKLGLWASTIGIIFICNGQLLGSEPRIVASIKPIHGLASAVMVGVGSPALLIKGIDSVHTHQLRPSDATIIENADVLLWIGPNLESSLAASISNLAKDKKVVELSEAGGLTLLPNREAPGAHGEHGHGHGHEDDHGEEGSDEEEDHGMQDLHIWLDTGNAKVMAQEIAVALQNAFPEYQNEFETNLNNVLQRLDALETELQKQAEPFAGSPYVVFHDAYQYLEKKLDLNNVGAVTANVERTPGVKRISELRQTIIDTGAVCVFSEPQFDAKILQTIAEGTELRFGVLDPLGAGIDEGPEAYFEIMRNMVSSLQECLNPVPTESG